VVDYLVGVRAFRFDEDNAHFTEARDELGEPPAYRIGLAAACLCA